jgi:ferredoxin
MVNLKDINSKVQNFVPIIGLLAFSVIFGLIFAQGCDAGGTSYGVLLIRGIIGAAIGYGIFIWLNVKIKNEEYRTKAEQKNNAKLAELKRQWVALGYEARREACRIGNCEKGGLCFDTCNNLRIESSHFWFVDKDKCEKCHGCKAIKECLRHSASGLLDALHKQINLAIIPELINTTSSTTLIKELGNSQ